MNLGCVWFLPVPVDGRAPTGHYETVRVGKPINLTARISGAFLY